MRTVHDGSGRRPRRWPERIDAALARWTDGGTLAWSRRLRRVGRGEGSSGLRFDVAELDEG